MGYSGDNEEALWAIESGLFDTLQTSFSLVDQNARTRLFTMAKSRGVGIIIKRPIANGAWGASSSASAYAQEYFKRAKAMAHLGPIPNAPADRVLLALAFVLTHPEVDTAIVGTHNPSHMQANLELLVKGLSIPQGVLDELYRRFNALGEDWVQLE